MFTRGLSAQTQANLAFLSATPFIRNYYLAGGTALSLYYGHRFSNDLDFFSPQPEQPMTIEVQLKDHGNLEVFQNDEGTFNGQLNGVKLSFFAYPYPMISPLIHYHEISVASVDDIACMKLSAISSRGTMRDFIDLYFICQKEKSLPELLALFGKKYKGVKYNKLHLLKSLVYFEDAQKDIKPKMIEKVDWITVTGYFQSQVRTLLPSTSSD